MIVKRVECDLTLIGLIRIFLVNLIELIIKIISQFLVWISLEEEKLSRLLIANKLSIRILTIELIEISSKRGIIAISSKWKESKERVIIVLNLIDKLFSQI